MALKKVGNTPNLPAVTGDSKTDIQAVNRSLMHELTRAYARLNGVLPKDGGETMEAPVPLQRLPTVDLPSAATWPGGIVFDTTTQSLRVSDGSSWQDLNSPDLSGLLALDGSTPMAAPLPLQPVPTSSLPSAASWEGAVLYDETTSTLRYSDGASWVELAVPAFTGLVGDLDALTDPGADRLLFWDDSVGALGWLSAGTGLTLSATTLAVSTNQRTAALVMQLDGNGAVLATGVRGDLSIPFACTITGVSLLADQTGSVVVDIWKDTYANFPPTDADSITASAPPTLSSASKAEDTTLTGWTTSIAAGDILRFNVDSAATITRLTLTLTVLRT